MIRSFRNTFLLLSASTLSLSAASARADIPTGYKGTPFDPSRVGGVDAGKIPPTVTAGPYPIPGRIDFINYDMGGLNVGYFTTDHVTNNGSQSVKLALGYRTDTPTATLCETNQVEKDQWYETGNPALDGTPFPSATTSDYYIGAIRPNDWFNITVDVATAGTYSLSSTFASGNGNPGGEGGDGSMELQVFVNGAAQPAADWKAEFPNYNTEADFHHWIPYPDFARIQLSAGLQVIKLQAIDPHLNLAYVTFSLVGADGGIEGDDASTGGASSGSTTPAESGSSSASGSMAASGSLATSGAAESGSVSSGSTTESSGAGIATGASGSATSASGAVSAASGAGTEPSGSSDTGSGGGKSGCSVAAGAPGWSCGWLFAAAATLVLGARRRSPSH